MPVAGGKLMIDLLSVQNAVSQLSALTLRRRLVRVKEAVHG